MLKQLQSRPYLDCIDCSYHRIQFTPDLFPADLTGTEMYLPQQQSFQFQKGPLFHNLLLIDEINHAPTKFQSTLLEAMSEKQITIGAQLDRFMLYIKIDYLDPKSEAEILKLNRHGHDSKTELSKPSLSQTEISSAQNEICELHISPTLEKYIIQLILATRHPEKYSDTLHKWIRFGASPRGTIALERAAKAHAWLDGHNYVSPHDIHAVIYEVLRHRLLLTFEAEVENITSDQVIDELLKLVPIP